MLMAEGFGGLPAERDCDTNETIEHDLVRNIEDFSAARELAEL